MHNTMCKRFENFSSTAARCACTEALCRRPFLNSHGSNGIVRYLYFCAVVVRDFRLAQTRNS